jgi:hypothetical protein
MSRVTVNVVVAGSLDGAALGRLEASGLRVRRVLRAVGVVSGTIDEAALPTLRAVPGVQQVEPTRPVRAVSRP